MIVLDMEQRTEEWFQARAGIPTASHASEIITPAKAALSASRIPYMAQLLAELSGLDEPRKELSVAHVQDGCDREPEAVATYEFNTGLAVKDVGLVLRDDGLAACSPDGLIVDGGEFVGGFEGKAPTAKTQFLRLLKGELPDEYKGQVHMSLAITGLPFWDFQSYYPGLDPLVVRVEPDDYTKKVAAALDAFITELHEAMARFGIELKQQLKEAA